MESKDTDIEMKILNIYGQMKKKDVLTNWTDFSKTVMKYLESEWSSANPPSIKEIQSVSETFIDNDIGNINKVINLVSKEDFSILLTFMIVGYDTIINGEKTV